jgi:hypothetical protein
MEHLLHVLTHLTHALTLGCWWCGYFGLGGGPNG